VDVLRLKPSSHLSASEIEAAELVRLPLVNTQRQERITWPSSPAVARAYLDQLERDQAIAPEEARAIRTALERSDAKALAELSAQITRESASQTGVEASRLRSLAKTIEKLKS
jgi:hypothetical protein